MSGKEKDFLDECQHSANSVISISTAYSRDASGLTQRKKDMASSKKDVERQIGIEKQASWRRILLLIIAITVHNIPGMI